MTCTQFKHWLVAHALDITKSQFDLWYHFADQISSISDVQQREKAWAKIWPSLKKEVEHIENKKKEVKNDF